MKKIIAFVSLACMFATAQADILASKRLISYHNYGMEALKVDMRFNDKVQIIVGNAILKYADNREMLDPVLNKKLEEIFGMSKINALIITVDSDSCREDKESTDIFACVTDSFSQSTAIIQAARIVQGVVVDVSPLHIEEKSLEISTMKMTERNANNSRTSVLNAMVRIDSLDMHNVKFYIGRHLHF